MQFSLSSQRLKKANLKHQYKWKRAAKLNELYKLLYFNQAVFVNTTSSFYKTTFRQRLWWQLITQEIGPHSEVIPCCSCEGTRTEHRKMLIWAKNQAPRTKPASQLSNVSSFEGKLKLWQVQLKEANSVFSYCKNRSLLWHPNTLVSLKKLLGHLVRDFRTWNIIKRE